MNVGFIGLGKLGLPCAEVMASHYNVIGYDTDHNKDVDKIALSSKLELAIKTLINLAPPEVCCNGISIKTDRFHHFFVQLSLKRCFFPK